MLSLHFRITFSDFETTSINHKPKASFYFLGCFCEIWKICFRDKENVILNLNSHCSWISIIRIFFRAIFFFLKHVIQLLVTMGRGSLFTRFQLHSNNRICLCRKRKIKRKGLIELMTITISIKLNLFWKYIGLENLTSLAYTRDNSVRR